MVAMETIELSPPPCSSPLAEEAISRAPGK